MTHKSITTVETVTDLRTLVNKWRSAGERIVLVPTMGALHAGHLSLVRLAKEVGDRVVVSIFVNPAQFAPNEDFDSYPRTFEDDLKELEKLRADLVFAPPRDEVYPENFSTHVSVDGLSEGLCGASRPHFFGGVATVVAKLLNQCRPDIAIFGEKDYQQLLVIRRMARDLDTGAEILGGPIVREEDGLAMSSRNAYLTPDERARAPQLHKTLTDIAGDLAKGGDVATLLEKGRKRLSDAGFEPDYLEVRNADTLEPIEGRVSEPARVFGAAMLGKTRLIDNLEVPGSRR